MKILQTVAVLALSQATLAYAGAEKGNGGHGVLCERGGKKTLTQYDIYEGKNKFGLDRDVGQPSDLFDKKVGIVLDRIKRINPSRAKRYSDWYAEFMDEADFVRGQELVLILDVGDGAVPADCTLKQLAIQRVPSLPGEKRYTINADLWDLMDSDSKASLVLHELIYREVLQIGQTTSKLARYYNQVASSKAIETMNVRQYVDLVRKIGFLTVDSPKVEICLNYQSASPVVGRHEPCDIEFDEAGNVFKADAVKGQPFSSGAIKGVIDWSADVATPFSFYPDGSISQGDIRLLEPTTFELFPQTVQLASGAFLQSIVFRRDGSILSLGVAWARGGSMAGHVTSPDFECDFRLMNTDRSTRLFNCEEIKFSKLVLEFGHPRSLDVRYIIRDKRIYAKQGDDVGSMVLRLPTGSVESVFGFAFDADASKFSEIFFDGHAIEQKVQGKKVLFEKAIRFYPEGPISRGFVKGPVTLNTVSGAVNSYSQCELEFDKQGLVVGLVDFTDVVDRYAQCSVISK